MDGRSFLPLLRCGADGATDAGTAARARAASRPQREESEAEESPAAAAVPKSREELLAAIADPAREFWLLTKPEELAALASPAITALKAACEAYIMTITKEIVDPMLSFITKVTAFRVSSSSQGKALRDAAFASEEKLAAVASQV